MSKNVIRVAEGYDLPENPSTDTVYHLKSKHSDQQFYEQRTDRNIGWITREEQAALRNVTIGIAGCGGMGGLLSQILLRSGIGTIKIADIEQFDTTNINRQFAALSDTIGKSKAFETAKLLRTTSTDTDIMVYPMGIVDDTAADFVSDCDLVIAEIEIFALYAYVLLHQAARRARVPVFDGLVVGWGTNLFYYEPDSPTVESMLGFSSASESDALLTIKSLTQAIAEGDESARRVLANRILDAFVPNLPTYTNEAGEDRAQVRRRLYEGQASIVSPAPFLATGVLANRIILHVLDTMSLRPRSIETLPVAPSFVSVDAAKLSINHYTRS